MNSIQIAVDGPSGSGKSTISKKISKKLSITYLDTGAMYRAITLKALYKSIAVDKIDDINELLNSTKIEFVENRINLDGEDVSFEIRSISVTENVSKFSAIKEIRNYLVKMQREISLNSSIIMDGRDIGSHVLPHAKYKFFLTASVEERSMRRYKEFLEQGKSVEYEKIKEDIILRDFNDSNRKESPLIKTDDAIEIDTTFMSIDEVIEFIVDFVRKGESL